MTARLSVDELLDRLGEPTVTAKAARLGVDRCVLYKYRLRGITVWTADELACRVWIHPAQVWPEWS